MSRAVNPQYHSYGVPTRAYRTALNSNATYTWGYNILIAVRFIGVEGLMRSCLHKEVH